MRQFSLFISLILFALLPGLVAAQIQSPTLADKVRELYIRAITSEAYMTSHSDWDGTPASAQSFLEELMKLGDQSNLEPAVCQVFTDAPAEKLYYIYDFINLPTQTQCVLVLRDKYQTYLLTQEHVSRLQALAAQELARPPQSPRATGQSQAPTPPPSLKVATQTIEVPVDVDHTPVLIDGGLAHKTVSLTFDDGPHPTLTPKLLDILRAENIKANFFLVGRNTRLYPHIVRQMMADGHEVGCHSFSHPDLRKLSFKGAVAEIEDGFEAIFQVLGVPGTAFRYPYGAKTTALQNYLLKTDTPDFFWNIDTLDWRHKDPNYLYKYSTQKIEREQRGIILMHDIQPQTISMVPALITYLKTNNYQTAVFRPTRARSPDLN